MQLACLFYFIVHKQ